MDPTDRLQKHYTEFTELTQFLTLYDDIIQAHMNDYLLSDMYGLVNKILSLCKTEDEFIKQCSKVARIGCCYSLDLNHSIYCNQIKPDLTDCKHVMLDSGDKRLDSSCHRDNPINEITQKENSSACEEDLFFTKKKLHEVSQLAPSIKQLSDTLSCKKVQFLFSFTNILITRSEFSFCWLPT